MAGKGRSVLFWRFGAAALMLAGFALASAALWAQVDGGFAGGGPGSSPLRQGNRLIVELTAPSLVEQAVAEPGKFAKRAGRLDLGSEEAGRALDRVKAGQASFLQAMRRFLPALAPAAYVNEAGRFIPLSFTVLINAVTVEPGGLDPEDARRALLQLPGVRGVYRERAWAPDLCFGVPLVNAPVAWANPVIGGQANAGAGIKFASVDGGVHHSSPMFNGAGYAYPPDIPFPGLGDPANNNGKIVVSRAYFRASDPPVAGDGNVWPGVAGTSHGVHTSGIAAGGNVDAAYYGGVFPLSGVAPKAWVLSYRVFYQAVSGSASFYDPEGIAALEDMVRDGAQVVNNSWGSGPDTAGGEYDPLDRALIRAAQAGVYVVMSNGNSGPGSGTMDHPSAEYTNVASVTTDGSYFWVNATAPEPVDGNLKNIPFAVAAFGGFLPAQPTPLEFVTAESLGNVEGCSAWSGTPFAGKAVLIRRGSCEYGYKALLAQQAGAALVIVYNSQAGGEALVNMSPGTSGGAVAIPAVFIGYSRGVALENWFRTQGAACRITVAVQPAHSGVQPDVLALSSSRGPGVGNVLKPDLAAPGVNILSQGYTAGTTGEARHFGFGQASGTSMAAPFVAGAAALLRQIHPGWSNAWIKSALMSTAKYLDVYTHEGRPAQPLDMGAGRLDLTRAADPGAILEPASLSFGKLAQGASRTLAVRVTSVADQGETYEVSTLCTENGFDHPQTLAGVTVSPSTLTLAPGAAALLTVTFDAAADGVSVGENQGFVILRSPNRELHLSAWARVTPLKAGRVLLLDNDGSTTQSIADYAPQYQAVLADLGYPCDTIDLDALKGQPNTVPPVGEMLGYQAVVYFTGNNSQGYGNNGMPPSPTDLNRLMDFANSGGTLIAMGQNLAALTGSTGSSNPTFYSYGLGGTYLQDSVTAGAQPTQAIGPAAGAPLVFAPFVVDVGAGGAGGAHNLTSIDEIDPKGTSTVPYWKLLRYPGDSNRAEGVVAMAHRDQPTLDKPGRTFFGRCIYATFGLEGVNVGVTGQGQVLRTFLDWAADAPIAVVRDKNPGAGAGVPRQFEAEFHSPLESSVPVSFRWDFGDGSAFTEPSASAVVEHVYANPGRYVVRLEVLDSYGNRGVGTLSTFVVEGVWFPRLGYVPGQATEGFGFVNPNLVGANLVFTGFNAAGQTAGTSPAPIPWAAGAQNALQAENPALMALSGETHGWAAVQSDQIGMLGFFLSELFDARGLVGLDGAPMSTAATTAGFFPRAASRGGYSTEFTIANPGAAAVQVTLAGYDGAAAYPGGTHDIAAHGALVADMATLFPVPFIGSVGVTSTGGVIGNARVKYQGESLSSVNLAPQESAALKLYAPHVTAWPNLFYTEVTLVNPGSQAARPVLKLSTAAGQPLGGPTQLEIPAHQVARLNEAALGLPQGQALDAWLTVESPDAPLLGSVAFGHPLTHAFESTLPLQSGGTTEYHFAQVATGNVYGVVYATGLAIVNPSPDQAVEVAISVHLSDGRVNGNVVHKVLQPGEKLVRQLEQIEGIGPLVNQSSGYLHLTATGPVLAFELFYDAALNFLSAVEGQY